MDQKSASRWKYYFTIIYFVISTFSVPPHIRLTGIFSGGCHPTRFSFLLISRDFRLFFVSASCLGFSHSSSEKLQALVPFAHLSGCLSFAFSYTSFRWRNSQCIQCFQHCRSLHRTSIIRMQHQQFFLHISDIYLFIPINSFHQFTRMLYTMLLLNLLLL